MAGDYDMAGHDPQVLVDFPPWHFKPKMECGHFLEFDRLIAYCPVCHRTTAERKVKDAGGGTPSKAEAEHKARLDVLEKFEKTMRPRHYAYEVKRLSLGEETKVEVEVAEADDNGRAPLIKGDTTLAGGLGKAPSPGSRKERRAAGGKIQTKVA